MAKARYNPRRAHPRKRQELIARLKASPDGWVCAICGKEIQRNPQYPTNHPLSWTCDEIIPASKWPQGCYVFSNLQPAHRICNMKKQDKMPGKKKIINKLPISRDWKHL